MREESIYVLRLWRDGDRIEDWRYSLESLHGDEHETFTTLGALYDFMDKRITDNERPS